MTLRISLLSTLYTYMSCHGRSCPLSPPTLIYVTISTRASSPPEKWGGCVCMCEREREREGERERERESTCEACDCPPLDRASDAPLLPEKVDCASSPPPPPRRDCPSVPDTNDTPPFFPPPAVVLSARPVPPRFGMGRSTTDVRFLLFPLPPLCDADADTAVWPVCGREFELCGVRSGVNFCKRTSRTLSLR